LYGEELLARRPTPKLYDHPLSAVRDRQFNIFEATLHIGDRSSTQNLRAAPCRGHNYHSLFLYNVLKIN